MLRALFAAVLAVVAPAAVSGTASAADFMSTKPVASWSGFYGGVTLGGAWGDAKKDSLFIAPAFVDPDVNAVTATASRGFKTSGFTGGVQAGYNLQQGSLVWGVESDFQYLGLKGSNNLTAPFPSTPAVSYSVATSVKTDWLFTARARFGTAIQNTLVYGTAGFAVAQQKFSQTIGLQAPFAVNNGATETRIGWTVGAGVEQAIDPNWSVKAEYLYVDLGKSPTSNGVISPAFVGVFDQTSVRLAFSMARIGLNRRF